MSPARDGRARAGTVLIVVAGVAALLASLTIAFLVRERSSAEETATFEREVQARIMLVAACDYVLETSRIGWDDGVDPWHREAYGWIDVRVNPATQGALPAGSPAIGPNARGATSTVLVPLHDEATLVEDGDGDGRADRPAWPAIGGVARCPMFVMRRPPFAIGLAATPNPIATDPGDPAHFGLPLLRNPDPRPVGATRAAYLGAEPAPRANSAGMSWFRAYRDSPATFVITCGAGGTQGFRDWNEVRGAGASAEAQFGGDPAFFASLLDQEVRFWYRIEWSPAVATNEVHNIKNAWNITPEDHYVSYGMNVSDSSINPRSQSHAKNFGGTIRWVERLRTAPSRW